MQASMARLPCVMGEFKGCCLLAGLYPSMKHLLNLQQLVSYGLGIPTVTQWTFFFLCADAESKINTFKGWVIRRCIDANSKKMFFETTGIFYCPGEGASRRETFRCK